jgi:hypothetical protein
VLAVDPLLREVIIALADSCDASPDDRVDLLRIALRRLTPASAPRHYLPLPADPNQRLQQRERLHRGVP